MSSTHVEDLLMRTQQDESLRTGFLFVDLLVSNPETSIMVKTEILPGGTTHASLMVTSRSR